MRQYIRDRTIGGTYFLTFNLLNRQQTLLTDNIDKVRLDYIHYNSVKHGHSIMVKDWPFSTFHYWVKQQVYSQDWGSNNQ